MTKVYKKHFVFDVDDTITDAYKFNQQLFVEGFASYIDITKPAVSKYLRNLHTIRRGVSMYKQFKEASDHLSLNTDPEKMAKDNEDLQYKKIDEVKLFDAVEDVIKSLKKSGREVSVCSNRRIGSLKKILKKHKLYNSITNIISCAETGHEKPDPYCLNKLVKDSGLKRKDFIYFGDSKTDFEFASKAKIDFIIIDHYLNKKKFYKMILESFINPIYSKYA